MTDEEITAAARGIALGGIQDCIDDGMGIGERLDEKLDGLSDDDADVLIERVTAELQAIRDGLAAQWGVTA